MGSSLWDVLTSLDLCKKIVHRVRINYFWAFLWVQAFVLVFIFLFFAVPAQLLCGAPRSRREDAASLSPPSSQACLTRSTLAYLLSLCGVPRSPGRYNTVGLPVAAGVLFPVLKVTLPPMLAGLAMVRHDTTRHGA